MACNRPLTIFNKYTRQYMQVSCRWCMGCRVARRSEWSTRIRLESFDYMSRGFGSSFVTFTYDDLHYNGNADLKEMQKLNKRLRYYLTKDNKGVPIDFKYYVVSEYGDRTNRGHFHAIYLGLESNFLLNYLRKAWQNGFVSVSPLSHSRIRYTLKYLDKQIVSKKQIDDYIKKYNRFPPSAIYSKGIGSRYFINNLDEIKKNNGLRVNGQLIGLNSYYSKKFNLDKLEINLINDYKNYDAFKNNRYGMDFETFDLYSKYCRELVLNNRATIGGFSVDLRYLNDIKQMLDHKLGNSFENYDSDVLAELALKN